MNKPEDPKKEVPILEHEIDGISELDNLLPRWWLWMFNLSILFSIGYMVYYHVLSFGDSQAAAYKKEARLGEEIKNAALTKFEGSLAELEPSKDETVLAHGLQVFTTYCAPCHRADGGGLVGPNLTDDYWIHGASYTDSLKTIINGVPEKGMLTWRGVLKPSEIQSVASYIYSLRGTTPPNPKPPENQQSADAHAPSEFE